MARLADRRRRRLQKALFLALLALVVAYVVAFGDHRPHHLALLWMEERRADERVTALEAERDTLSARVASVRADSLALERLAREKGLMRPGDLVYRIVPVPPDVREAAAESLAQRAARDAAAEDSAAAARAGGALAPGARPPRPAPARPRPEAPATPTATPPATRPEVVPDPADARADTLRQD